MNALGMIELNNIPLGVAAADAMLKAADVELVTAQAECPGKYVAIITGDVAAVQESVAAGCAAGRETLVDSLVIPHVDPQVPKAVNACNDVGAVAAVGVLETLSMCAAVEAADGAVKAARVDLLEVRLGRGLGGKAFVTLTGEVAAVEAAVQAASKPPRVQKFLAHTVIIPSPHPELVKTLY